MLTRHRPSRTRDGEPVYDITFENVQAGERTSHLFRLANLHGALVVGTGDLSELALGWCTYGVGDHMSHYNVNASVPKTLIKHLVRWVADERLGRRGGERRCCDDDPRHRDQPRARARATPATQPAQSTEDAVGPYELQDFHLYYIAALRLRADQGRVPRVDRLARRRAGRLARRRPTSRATQYTLGRDQEAPAARSC